MENYREIKVKVKYLDGATRNILITTRLGIKWEKYTDKQIIDELNRQDIIEEQCLFGSTYEVFGVIIECLSWGNCEDIVLISYE